MTAKRAGKPKEARKRGGGADGKRPRAKPALAPPARPSDAPKAGRPKITAESWEERARRVADLVQYLRALHEAASSSCSPGAAGAAARLEAIADYASLLGRAAERRSSYEFSRVLDGSIRGARFTSRAAEDSLFRAVATLTGSVDRAEAAAGEFRKAIPDGRGRPSLLTDDAVRDAIAKTASYAEAARLLSAETGRTVFPASVSHAAKRLGLR